MSEASLPRVTVFLPTHNRRALVDAAIDSVLAQTHRNLELVAVDDGSQDGTWEHLQAREAAEPRLRVARHEQPQGAPAARNRALAMATGEFVTGLDDDDRFRPDRLARFVEAWQQLEREQAAFSGLYAQDIAMRGGREQTSCKPAVIAWQQMFRYNQIGNQLFTRRDWLLEVGGYDIGMPAWQDLDVFIRLLRRRGPARLVDHGTYEIDLEERPDRISRLPRERIELACRRLQSKHPDVPAHLRQALFLQLFGDHYGFRPGARDVLTFLRWGVHRGNLRRFLDALRRSPRHQP